MSAPAYREVIRPYGFLACPRMYRELCGRKISPLGVGTWKMGGGDAPDRRHDAEEIAALKLALEAGVTVVDTAEMYGAGHAEELVGKAIEGFPREDLFLISKVLPRNLKRADLKKALHQSLKRLGTEYIDLYLIHWPPADLALVAEGLAAMEEEVARGAIRSIGVSNFDTKEMEFALQSLKRTELAANQIEYSLVETSPERDVIPFCEKNKIAVIAYTPLADGKVASIPVVKKVAKSVGHTPIQVALNYLMRRSLPIPKASKPSHLREILGAMGWELSEKEYAAIRSQ